MRNTQPEGGDKGDGNSPPSAVPSRSGCTAGSGIGTAADVRRMRAAGVHRFLVGESLMRQPSPRAALEALLA